MRLHVTLTSPYARMARIAIIEHGLQDRIAIVDAATRRENSPYYALTPSGRVPYLERDDGPALEESDLICAYLDSIGDGPPLTRDPSLNDWQYAHLHALARSFLDGIAVWSRELRRPEEERSPTILAHEEARSIRLADAWEREIANPLMHEPLNLAQLALYCACDSLKRTAGVEADDGRPALAAWRARLRERPSIAATAP